MLRRTASRSLQLVIIGGALVAFARLLRPPANGGRGPHSPVISADTWPPVPINPDRARVDVRDRPNR